MEREPMHKLEVVLHFLTSPGAKVLREGADIKPLDAFLFLEATTDRAVIANPI